MGIIIGFIFFCIIFFIVCAYIGTKGQAPRQYHNYGHDYDDEDFDDEPAVNEGDEFGPEVGDDIDYQGTHYRLYGYCGYEVVLQNVDDERDFKVVKPEDVGVRDKQQQDIEETNWVDPDRLPEGKACGA